jgi:hypothetical protein
MGLDCGSQVTVSHEVEYEIYSNNLPWIVFVSNLTGSISNYMIGQIVRDPVILEALSL